MSEFQTRLNSVPSGGFLTDRDKDKKPILDVRELGIDFGGLTAVNEVSFDVEQGSIVGLIGHNGAGKTTLVKLLCGFLDPTEGRVLLNGQDIRPYNRRDYYKLLAAVIQAFSVLSATVAENVAQCRTGIDEARVWHCLDEAGLTEKVQSLPKQLETQIGREVYEDGIELSGGQPQRLMLARALFKDAPVLVLDEPTAALDPIAENDIYQKYNEMTAGKTSLFISHRLASTRFCDRILYLKDGRVAEEGTHEELLDALTTVRYPRARMRRLAMDAALGYDDALPALPPYLHLLGANREALSLLKEAHLPVSHALMRLKDENDACARMVSAQLTASDFSALCRKTPEPMGSALRQKIIFLTK